MPILETRTQRWPDEAACAASAAALGANTAALAGACIELHGPLGAGKTTFVRHLLRALGVAGHVKSPTYAVLEPYEVVGADGEPLAVSHFDFYRFDDPQEWEDAGFRDVYAAPGLKLAEWPEKAEGLLPVPDLTIRIEPLDDGDRDGIGNHTGAAGEMREVRFDACTERGRRLLA